VSTATEGFEALAKIAAEKPDLVLLDVMMPDLDGFEVCQRVKTIRRRPTSRLSCYGTRRHR